MAGAAVDRCFRIERASQRPADRGLLTVVPSWIAGGPCKSQRRAMEHVNRDEIGALLVARRDRPCRFGFDWFEHLMAIVHTFSPTACTGCATAGSRSARSRKMAKVHKVTSILHSDGRLQLAAVRNRHAAKGNPHKARNIESTTWARRNARVVAGSTALARKPCHARRPTQWSTRLTPSPART